MSSVSPFRFPNGTELLMRSVTIPHYLYTAQVGGQSQSPGEGKSLSAGESTVTTIKTENWANTSADRCNLENQRPQQSHAAASQTSIDRLALLASVASESIFDSGSDSASAQFAPNMSAYIPGSSAQSEALHLMNPNFAGYGDPSNTSNVVLINSVGGGQDSPLGRSEQHQQQFTRFAIPSAVNQPSYSHPSYLAAVANTQLGNQNSATDLYTRRANSQGYSWGVGNEFSFLPSSHVSESNHEIHINSMKAGQLSTHDMSHFSMGSMTPCSYHEQAPMLANSIAAAQSVDIENVQAHANGGHVLSLSLSSQQPLPMQHLNSFSIQQNEPASNFFHGLANTGSDSLSKEAMALSSKCAVGSVGGSFTIPSCENMLGAGYHPQLNSPDERHGNFFSAYPTTGSYGSKYLKPAQDLLNEVVSVGQVLRGNALKRPKLQSWMMGPPSSCSDLSLMKSVNAVDSPSKALISWNGGGDADPVGTAAASISIPGNPENAKETVVELSTSDRQELHEKRAKLEGMRDEVDRRYKQYYHQMQVVATSFESVAGWGAAAAYTAVALQTISKHFRCLRDAIIGQIQAVYKALGEEEVSGITRGETSKLRQIDQQLRQQRALRQLGMMQQQAWRPQRGLPEHSVSILRAWLFEHFLHPYPKDADKVMLAKQTGLNRNQVSNWFINARVRLWKPMVEEMYLEEVKEADVEKADKLGGSHKDPGIEGKRAGMVGESTVSEFGKTFLQTTSSGANDQGFGDVKGTSGYASDALQTRALDGRTSDHILPQEKESMRQGGTESRPLAKEVSPFLCVEYKNNKANMDCAIEGENKGRGPGESYKEQYVDATHDEFVQADQLNSTAYGSYQLHGLTRYGQENFGGGSGYGANGGVSLTLGLQHCDGITFSGGQQHYTTQAGGPHLLTSRQGEDDAGSADYYNANGNSYEVLGLQSRKPFPPHMLCHDFVV